MLKRAIGLIMIVITTLLNSCVEGEGFLWHSLYDDDGIKAEARIGQVIEAIDNRDKEGLKSMFSKQALNEAQDIEEGINYLFDFVQGVFEPLEKQAGPSVSESNHYGHKTKEARSFYYVNTDKQKYIFFLLECIVDTDNPDNVGVYTLRVIKAEDEDTQLGYWQDMKIAGIYKPEE